jgi:spermidine synthase
MAWAISHRMFFAAIFLSGFSALIYQLIWVRLLGLVFGVNSFAVATVVAVFLLGLGLGSYYFGKWSDRLENPLKVYMLVEVSIAVFSLLSYLIINHLPIYKLLYEFSYNNLDFYGISLVRLLLSILVLLPPVFVIGGTIPLVSKYFLTSTETLGSNFSKIYYMNTLGAFAGALLTGFVLVKFLGVFLTFMIAVCFNLIVAWMICATKIKAEIIPEKSHVNASHTSTYMLAVLFTTGFIGLSYEILWVRILSTYDLSTSESFALIVSGFLLGFSIGSYLISKKIDFKKTLELFFSKICVLVAISGAVALYVFQRFAHFTSSIAAALDINVFTVSLAVAFIVSFVPAIFMGILFPLGLRIYSNDVNGIGIKTGKIFFSNTFGCVAGSILTGFLLIPFVGMWNTTLILVNLSLLIAVYMVFKSDRSLKKHLATLLVVFLLTNTMVFSDRKTFHKEIEGFDVIFYSEGLSGTITAIERKGYRGLFVDGQNVSGTDPVLTADSKMLAHLPLLIAENPKKALTVGYGTGATSYSMLLHGVDVDAVEIEKKVIDAGYLFEKVNYNSYENDNLNIVIDDARNYIDAANERYDVIVTDVTNLKYKRNPYLYTQEYFEIMQDALVEDGVAAAWLPLGGLSFNDLKILIRTFDRVYPHTTIWYFTQYPTHFIIVIGTPDQTKINLDKLANDMEKVEIDLKRLDVDNEFELASMLLLGEHDVDNLVSGDELHTDNFPILEYSDMEHYMMIDLEANLDSLLKYQTEDLSKYFVGESSQIAELNQHIRKYKKHYRDFINVYKQRIAKKDAL